MPFLRVISCRGSVYPIGTEFLVPVGFASRCHEKKLAKSFRGNIGPHTPDRTIRKRDVKFVVVMNMPKHTTTNGLTVLIKSRIWLVVRRHIKS